MPNLGIAQAEVYDASRLANPSVGYVHLSGDGGRHTWSLTQSFTELLFLHYHTTLGRSVVLQAQQRVAQAVLDLEAEVRRGYYHYVTALLVSQLHEQNYLAAQASADYAQSLYDAGNINELQLRRERGAASEAKIAWRAAQTDATQQRGDLLISLGIAADQQANRVAFVDRLDVPVAQMLVPEDLQQWAEQQRLDLQLRREQLALSAQQRTHAHRWFWLDKVELQAEREAEAGSTLQGVGGSVGVPLFNQGGGAKLRADAQWETAQSELAQLQVLVGNQIVAEVAAIQNALDVVQEYRNNLVPLRERVVALQQQQQNYMFIGAFELLSAKRELLNTYQDYLRATGDYWIKHVDLQQVVGGRLPDSAGDASYGISVGVDALPESSNESMSGMDMGAMDMDKMDMSKMDMSSQSMNDKTESNQDIGDQTKQSEQPESMQMDSMTQQMNNGGGQP